MSAAIRRTLCFHQWSKWSEPFQGTWSHREQWGEQESTETTTQYMTQRRCCEKCGKVVYRKCT